MVISGFRRIVSPAGLASAAEASSASPRNAPPIPSERAPGLPKLNCRPESDSMSVFWAASGSAASVQTAATKRNLRIDILRDWIGRRITDGQKTGAAEGESPRPVRRRESLLPSSDEDDHQRALALRSLRRAEYVCLADGEVQRRLEQRRELILLCAGKSGDLQVLDRDRIAGRVVLAELEVCPVAGLHVHETGI